MSLAFADDLDQSRPFAEHSQARFALVSKSEPFTPSQTCKRLRRYHSPSRWGLGVSWESTNSVLFNVDTGVKPTVNVGKCSVKNQLGILDIHSHKVHQRYEHRDLEIILTFVQVRSRPLLPK